METVFTRTIGGCLTALAEPLGFDSISGEKILDIRTRMGCDTFVGVFSSAGVPWEEAERNVHLFAREVGRALPALDGEARAGVPTAAEAAARRA